MKRQLPSLSTVSTLLVVLLTAGVAWTWMQDHAASQQGPLQGPLPGGPPLPGPYVPPFSGGPTPGAAPAVIHIHHHYANLSSNNTEMATSYAPGVSWNYGYQPGMGNYVRPWTQNWGHLGFTGYLGQQGEKTGLVVDKLTAGSPAAQLGLVPGDFILAINGQPVSDYKQVTILFDESVDKPKASLSLQVWNPTTNRTATLKTELDSD